MTNLSAGSITGCQVGFENRFKLGCWTPVRVSVEGLESAESPRLEVIAADGEGSPAAVSTRLEQRAGATFTVDTLTRVGRQKAPLRVRLLDG
ncbi:MAG: hypothetical protein KC492_36295, partial [Myxococcales bacterium]|nr:hypothetical protein [Myxococcales bacterium]